ncbi:hypothetical protein R5W60_05570 [Brucella pseudintermedia]|uniref:phage adaptor protein n=1 Tax=Brucella pseudintermedia TaxID=370111 RepID=UPI00366AC798|nr:hypothetical protein R5W60_04220 [Brucella pseudintermedia]WPM81162.1 hypothetical protein R5W60_05570 [Brucella pseudintermedia]
MPIIVQTSGPNNTIPALLDAQDRTFYDMMTVIADEVDDTTGEYTAQIQNCIFSAIRFCERDVYYFNETRDVTFPTVSGREWYDANDNPNIPTLVRIVAAYSEDSTGQRSIIKRAMPEDIEIVSDNAASRGEPYCYTYFGQRLRLYPVPGDEVYTIRLQLGPYRLADILTSTDSNAWFTEAFDMVKARAKYQLYKDFLKDADLAAAALNDYNEENAALSAETSRRNGRGRIIATCF